MDTQDTRTTTAGAGFCTGCGTALAGGRFCSGCGEPVVPEAGPFPRHEAAAARGAATADGFNSKGAYHADAPPVAGNPLLDDIEATQRLAPPPPYPGAPGAPARRRRWPFAVAGALIAAGIAAALIIILSGSSSSSTKGPDEQQTYTAKVTAAFAPVNNANHRLSNALENLDGAKRPGAAVRTAVARSKSASSAARGALDALTVPTGSQQLTTQLRQALDRQDAYLSAVDAALSDQSNPAVSQLQTLSGNLTDALDAVGAPLGGAAQNVRGADSLTGWAQRRRRAAARNHARQQQQASSSPGSGGSAASASPLASGRDCGAGLHAGPNTTCEFAQNVREAWAAAPGLANTIQVYSPATGQTYTMNCAPAGTGITCSGGNNASVSW
jgi:hypothetical protein